MMGSGFLTEAVMEKANEKLEQAIEDLRIKYAKIEEEKQKQKAEEAKLAAVVKAAEEKKEEENDWSVEDPDLEALRRERIAKLMDASKAAKSHKEAGHGELREIVEEDFLKDVTSTKYVMVHFYHTEYISCKVMDKHLRILAPSSDCLHIKMLKLNAEKSPFFTNKLKVRTLPTIVFFIDGIAVDRIIGFNGLVTPGGKMDDFPTSKLLTAIKVAGMMGDKAKKEASEEYAAEEEEEEEEEDSSSNFRGMRRGAAGGAGGWTSVAAYKAKAAAAGEY